MGEKKDNQHITLENGNIFLTNYQTIVITVNCAGVMGKGIALQAKDLFPDAFLYYKDLCEKDEMHMGEPVLYDKPSKTLQGPGKEYIKLLLFPTKQHWKMPGDIVSIEKGLQWLVDNYEKCGIKSLAIPALGCGNGGLNWKDIGPLLYKYLGKMNIPVEIYYPSGTPEKYLDVEFLLTEPPKITDY